MPNLLRAGRKIGRGSWNEVIGAAREARGGDRSGLRGEFVRLVEQGRWLVDPDHAMPALARD